MNKLILVLLLLIPVAAKAGVKPLEVQGGSSAATTVGTFTVTGSMSVGYSMTAGSVTAKSGGITTTGSVCAGGVANCNQSIVALTKIKTETTSNTPGAVGFTGGGLNWALRENSVGDFALDEWNGSAYVQALTVKNSATNAVGIGTTNPSTQLDVNGNAQFGSGITKSTFTTTGGLNMAAQLKITTDAPGVADPLQLVDSGSGGGRVTLGDSFLAKTLCLRAPDEASSTTCLESWSIATGRVGILDATPDAELEVLSNVAPTGYVIAASSQTDNLASIWGVTAGGHVVSSGTTPSIACSAGAPVMLADSNDMSGEFTGGAASTNCTVTFVNAFTKKPRCFCQDGTSIIALKAVTTTTTLVCTSATTIGTDAVMYGCMAAP